MRLITEPDFVKKSTDTFENLGTKDMYDLICNQIDLYKTYLYSHPTHSMVELYEHGMRTFGNRRKSNMKVMTPKWSTRLIKDIQLLEQEKIKLQETI